MRLMICVLSDDVYEQSSEWMNSIDALFMTVRSMKNRPEFFADKLHDSIKRIGTNDSRLIRIIVSRCEVGDRNLKVVFMFFLVTICH